MKLQADLKKKEFEAEISRLWKYMQNLTPEKRNKFVQQLDEPTVNALRTRSNPYKKPVFIGDRNRYLAFSVINLTEKYSQRFAMTSLIGFLYRMLDEFAPKASKEYVSENDPAFANIYNTKVKTLTAGKPESLLNQRWADLKAEIEQLKGADNLDKLSRSNLKSLIRESFVVRAKIIKYRNYINGRDLETLKDAQNYALMRINATNHELKQIQEIKGIFELKLRLRLEYDAKKANDIAEKPADVLDDELDDDMPALEEQPQLQWIDDPDLPSEDYDEKGEIRNLKNTLTIQDINIKLTDFHKILDNKTKNIALVTERLTKLQAELDEKTEKVDACEKFIKDHKDKLTQLKTEYDQIFTVGQAKPDKPTKAAKSKSKSHLLDDVEIDQYDPTEDELNGLAEETKKELKISMTAEEFNEEYQSQVQEFLDEYLVYNPDLHVRCAYKPNYEDPLRTPLEMDVHRKEKEAEYGRSLLPPDDTFFRLNRYIENNYEELRQATDDIYCEKSDFEFAIVPLEVFEDADSKSAEDKMREFQRKYADEFDCEVLGGKFGNWNLLGSWAQNRQVRDFYTEKTEIIKRIIDQHKDDARMGQKLMKDRAEQKKKENDKQNGPNASSFTEQRKSHPPVELEKHGGRHISDINVPEFIDIKDVPRDMDESNNQEVEVDVHHIKPRFRKGSRRITAYGERFKFNIPAETMKENSVNLDRPADYHKKVAKKEKKERKQSLMNQ